MKKKKEKMKPSRLLFLSCLFFAGRLNAQSGCQTISFGELFEKLKYIDVSRLEPLVYKKYHSFSFKNFKPVEGEVSDLNFFEIGFNAKGEIREIVHRESKDSLTNYRMLVYDYPNCRILTLGTISDGAVYGYWSVALVMDKKTKFNYMVNTDPVLGDAMIRESAGGIIYKGIGHLSVIVLLDQDLFPTDIFRLSEGDIVFYSEIRYKNGREIDYEQARVFFSPTRHENLKIGVDVCPAELKQKISRENEDMDFRLFPSDISNFKFAPQWIQLGFPNYR